MAETQLLEKIADDVSFLKDRIISIEEELNEINLWRHYGVGKVEFGKPAFN